MLFEFIWYILNGVVILLDGFINMKYCFGNSILIKGSFD